MSIRTSKQAWTRVSARLVSLTLVTALILGSLLPAAVLAAPNTTPAQDPVALGSGPAWVFQGPAPQTNAQQDLTNVAEPDESVSGAVAAIAASPTDPDLVYLGAANGGVWKTTNATDALPTWTPLTDQLQSLSMGIDALAMDPLDATGQTVIAGTGRFSGYANRGDDLVGLYYTTDGGASWITTTDPQLSAANVTGVAARGNTLLAASENGLFRSTTGPLGTWTKISGTGGLPNTRASSIKADPADNNRLYVTFTGATGGLFRTDNLGATWTNITGNIGVISSDTTAFEVAVFNDGSTNVITVVLNGTVSGAPGNAILRSVNGAAFTALDVPFVFRDAYGKFGIAADRANPSVVYVSGGYALTSSNPFLATTTKVDASQPNGSQLTLLYNGVSTYTLLAMSSSTTTIYVKSAAYFPQTTPFDIMVDAEQMTVTSVQQPSWYYTMTVVRAANGTTAAEHIIGSTVTSGATYGAHHVDINTLATNAAGSLLMGAHGGIFMLPNPASTPTFTNTWLSKNGNLGVSEMHDIAYDHVSGTLIGSNQDNCIVYQTAPGDLTWPVGPGFSGDGGDVAVADIGGGQSARYAANQNIGSFQRQIYDAANNLVEKTTLSTSVITDKQFTTPVVVNEVDPSRLLIGGSANLYESLNSGDTIGKIATVGVYNRAIAYGGRRNGLDNPDVLYVSPGTRAVYVRTAAGGAVVKTTDLPTAGWYPRDIVMNPADWMNVFVADADGVFESKDAGATWTDVTGNLLSVSSDEFWTLEVVQGPAPYLAVGTRSGVFVSSLINVGSWTELGTTLPDVLVYDLDYDATDDVLAAGTLGRGAWLLADASTAFVVPAVAPILTLTGPTTANEGSVEYVYSFTVNDPGDVFAADTPTVIGGTLVAGSLVTTAAGGSFNITYDDGPAAATVSLQVTDSTALPSNIETINVTVNNVKPVVAILGAPTSGSPGTTINLTGSVSDASADTAAGFTYAWLVQKYVNNALVGNFAYGSELNFSYTPDVAGKYNVFFKATDKDGAYGGWVGKTINAASPDLTLDALSVTVSEGMAAQNSGAYAHDGAGPLQFSASVGSSFPHWPLAADDFDGESPANGTTTLSKWGVQTGNVDVLGSGSTDLYPGNGNYLDLDGTANATIRTRDQYQTLATYFYELSFKIGRNLDGPDDNSVRAKLGTAFDETFAAPTALTTVMRRFAGGGPTQYLTFSEQGPSDGYGTILDDVKLAWLNPPSVSPSDALYITAYWQLGEDDADAAGGATGNSLTLARRRDFQSPATVLFSVFDLAREGSPTYTSSVAGSSGSVLAMSFNGSTDAYTRTRLGWPGGDRYGIEAWVRPSAARPGKQYIWADGNLTSVGIGLYIENGVYGVTLPPSNISFGVAATADTWQNVALINDSSTFRLYVDGVQRWSGSLPQGYNANAGIMGIGRAATGGYFQGAIDEVRLFTFLAGRFDPQYLLINTFVSDDWSWSYAPDDGPAEGQIVTITATTGVSGDVTSIPFTLIVENVAPIATLGDGGPVDEGSTATVSFSDQADPSMADMAAGLHYAFDLDDDGVLDVGDGTYAGSGTNASATVPAALLVDGPSTHRVRGRIIDKDDGFNDYTTDLTINNTAPTASVSGPASALVGQLVPFLLEATDASADDQAAGFTYSIDWGDGSSLQTVAPVAGTGDATVRHAYATPNNYAIQVTATDKDGAVSVAPASASIQVDAADASSLQTLIASAPFVELDIADDAALQNAIAAINGLTAPASPVAITLVLGAGPYGGVVLNPPSNIILDLAGNDTSDNTGTQIFSSTGPAVTVTGGEVFVQGDILATSADAPAVLVTGGHLTLDQVEIQESGGFLNVAVSVTGGSANLGFDVLMQMNGQGAFVHSYARSALVPHPEGIDAELTPNTYQVDGQTINAVSLSSTSLTSAPAPTAWGEAVTFTALVDVKAIEHGLARGKVTFYDGETLIGQDAVSYVSGQFVAHLTTSALSLGDHTIMAIYEGDDAYVASAAYLVHTVVTATNQATASASGGPAQLCPGYNLYYAVMVTNTSASAPLTNVVITAAVPAGTWYAPGGATGTVNGVYSEAGGVKQITWTIPAVAANQRAIANLILHSYSTVTEGTVISETFGWRADLSHGGLLTVASTVNRAACGTPPGPQDLVIRGQVTSDAAPAGGLIAGATVTATLCLPGVWLSTTDAQGRYEITIPGSVAAACPDVTLAVSAPGHRDAGGTYLIADLRANGVRDYALQSYLKLWLALILK